MNHFLSILLSLALLVSSSVAFAVREVGNGGDAIVCTDPVTGVVNQVLLYDYYEADQIRRIFPIGFSKVHSSYGDYLKEMLSRVERLNPNRAKLYRGWLKTFAAEAEFLRGISLVDIPDTGNGYVPKGCKLEQLVVQRDPRFKGEMRYTISLDLFDKLSERDKAGIIFHELVLREMVHQKTAHVDSINTRIFNSMASSMKIEKMNLKEYLGWLTDLRVEMADAQFGIPIAVSAATTFHDENTVASASPIDKIDPSLITTDVQWRTYSFPIRTWSKLVFNLDGHLRRWDLDGAIQISLQKKPVLVEGKIQSFELAEGDRPIKATGEIPIETSGFRGVCSEIELDSGGSVTSCQPDEKSTGNEIFLRGKWMKIRPARMGTPVVRFDPNGRVRSAKFVGFDRIENADFRGACDGAEILAANPDQIASCEIAEGEIRVAGKWIPYAPLRFSTRTGSKITFDSSGEVLTAETFVPSVKSAIYEGSCAGIFLEPAPSRELAGCGNGNDAQTSTGSVFIQGKWYRHSGELVLSQGKLIRGSKVSAIQLPMLQGDLKSFEFDSSGVILKATLQRGSQVKQTSSTQNQWLMCSQAWVDCELAFGSNGLLSKGQNLTFQVPFKGTGEVEFFSSGELQRYKGQGANDVIVKGRTLQVASRYSAVVKMTVTGKVQSIDGEVFGKLLETPVGLLIGSVSDIEFFADETVELLTLLQTTTLPTLQGPRNFQPFTSVRFDRQGNASEVAR